MSRVRFRGRDRVRSIFLDNHFGVLYQQKMLIPGMCLAWQNHGDRKGTMAREMSKNVEFRNDVLKCW